MSSYQVVGDELPHHNHHLKCFNSVRFRILLIILTCITFITSIILLILLIKSISITNSYSFGNPYYFNNGLISSDSSLCSSLSLSILHNDGGNAIDAAVVTALCIGIVHPMSSGLGGGSVILLR